MKKEHIPWKSIFASRILDRGFNYYLANRVSDIQKFDDVYLAQVRGTKEYTVRAEWKDGNVGGLSCNCPYADSGFPCKHMAAVLYKLESCSDEQLKAFEAVPEHSDYFNNYYSQDQDNSYSQDMKDAAALISSLSAEQIKDLLLKRLPDDPGLCDYICTLYSNEQSQIIIKELKKKIQETIDEVDSIISFNHNLEYLDYSNYFTDSKKNGKSNVRNLITERLEECGKNLSWILNQIRQQLIKKNRLSDTLLLIQELFSELDKRLNYSYVHDFKNNFNPAKLVDQFLRNNLKELPEQNQRLIIEFFLNEESNIPSSHRFYTAFLKEFLNNALSPQDRAKQEMENINQELEKKRAYMGEAQIVSLINRKEKLMRQLNYSEEEIENFLDQYNYISGIRISKIQKYIKSGEITAAIELLKQSKKIDEDSALQQVYCQILIELYGRMHWKKELESELIEYYISYGITDKRYFYLLKEVMPKEKWLKERKEIFQAAAHTLTFKERLEYLAQENLIDDLFHLIYFTSGTKNWLRSYSEYEEILREEYIEELTYNLMEIISEEISVSSTIRSNDLLIDALKRLRNYPGGINYVYKTVDDLRTRSRPDPILLKMLDQNGF